MSKKLQLIIEGDWNDGDYVTEISLVTEKQLSKLIPIFKKIKNYKKGNNWEDSTNYLSEEELMDIEEYIPSGYEQSIHTIKSITIQKIDSNKNYL